MTRTRSMENLSKIVPTLFSDKYVFISESSDESSSDSQQFAVTKKCPAPNPTSSVKKPCSRSLDPFSPKDMHKFWTDMQNENFSAFKNRVVVPERIVNLYQLKDAHCNLETLVIGTRITLNDFLFEKVFDTKFSGAIPLMNGSWPDEFEVSFKEAKQINWAAWFREYMLESTADAHTFSSLSYGLLITRILQYYSIDLSAYPPVEISATYDSKYLQAWDAS
ncbi:putative protein isoform X1 [Capsicum galapagoense]